ncbi:disintegrin and metalloproteinase domain-containing protein 8 [Ctenopharyngodon idella]|uniref:disintegrin and metalloproteinase domain-containing protein 8 n=1 Tax=Ctenopharyngodon idella TaxID=7959 RepID=UPI00222F2285|nr:disintegrin and metalloproteinase domain-containing protein 8 [Ctenopharyngodon idella]
MQCSAFTARVLCCLCLWGCVAESIHTLPHVEQFDVVRPKRQSIRKVQSDISPQSHEMYPDRLAYKLFFGGENHMIHLEKNRQLIGHNYTEIYYQDDGLIVSRNPNLKENCYYHGHIQDLEDSSVSVTICSGIRGFVRLKNQVYLIEPLTNHTDGDHALYKHQHLRWKRSSCGEPETTVYDHEPPVALPLKSRGWKMESSHTPRFVELFLVVDNTEYRNYGSNMDIIRARMLEVANHIDKLYRPHNIRVMLVGLEVWTKHDQFVVSVSSDDTLSRFIKWRKSNLLKRVRHDNAQFVTGIDFLGDTVGLANKYAMCAESSAGVNQDHNKNPLGLASTIAHEMGHNMGMSHDEDHCTCGSDTLYNSICIMTERVGTQFPEQFSDCSLEQLSVFLDSANPSCLLDRPSSNRLYSGPVCGNAFLDPGEQCDCGTVEECENPCCNPTTCQLTEGSQCAHGDCCKNCQIKDAENLCREAVNECDIPEYCTGLSEKCPENDFKMNGIPCSSGSGYCYNGQCPTHLKHCQRLWGTSAKKASEACFLHNTYGKNDSHCGKTKDGYRACTKANMMCGKIFCDGGNEYPITGQKAVIVTLRGMCNIAGEQSEEDTLSMVPTGTKCGHNKVCYNYMCQDLNVYGSDENCSLKCSGRGICNHKKQCHCEPGWAPPFCEFKYSESPPVHPKIIGISVAVAIALLVLICGVVFYRKKRKGIISHKTKAPSSGQLLLFENNSANNDRPQISQPIFMGTTVTQPCTPLTARVGPARPAPPPPKKPPSQPQQITVKQGIKPPAPPVPPVKPSLATGSWTTDQVAGDTVKVVLRPPTIPRR